jgi:cation transport regulator ChaB
MEEYKILFTRVNKGSAPKYTHRYITRRVKARSEKKAIKMAWVSLRTKYKDADKNYRYVSTFFVSDYKLCMEDIARQVNSKGGE